MSSSMDRLQQFLDRYVRARAVAPQIEAAVRAGDLATLEALLQSDEPWVSRWRSRNAWIQACLNPAEKVERWLLAWTKDQVPESEPSDALSSGSSAGLDRPLQDAYERLAVGVGTTDRADLWEQLRPHCVVRTPEDRVSIWAHLIQENATNGKATLVAPLMGELTADERLALYERVILGRNTTIAEALIAHDPHPSSDAEVEQFVTWLFQEPARMHQDLPHYLRLAPHWVAGLKRLGRLDTQTAEVAFWEVPSAELLLILFEAMEEDTQVHLRTSCDLLMDHDAFQSARQMLIAKHRQADLAQRPVAVLDRARRRS